MLQGFFVNRKDSHATAELSNHKTIQHAVTAYPGFYDTSEMLGVENVSYGLAISKIMADGRRIDFILNHLGGVTRIDERNLMYCKFLSLNDSFIEDLDITLLVDLEMVVLTRSNISKIDLTALPKLSEVWGCNIYR